MAAIQYATATGVLNTRVKNQEAATFAEFVEQNKTVKSLDMSVAEYHAATKRQRGDAKKGLPYIVGGAVEGKRDDNNVRHRSMLTLDIEFTAKRNTDQPPPPQAVFEKLQELGAEGWVYTTVSHQAKEPRYRVLLPLREHITDAATLEATTRRAAQALGIGEWCTPESWVLSQPMYLPARLKGGTFYSKHASGKDWKTAPTATKEGPADIPDGKLDPVLVALQRAGLYLEESDQKGKHFIKCPFADQHGAVNDTQTVYFEAHHDGSPRPAVKCLDTEPDEDGKPHLTYRTLVQWLRDNGYLASTEEDANTTDVLEDFDAFDTRARVGEFLAAPPEERDWVWEGFAPVGKVTVLGGPGGVSKSMLMLHLLAYGALGQPFADIKPSRPVRALYVSYEDDKLELHKRVYNLANALREQDGGIVDMLYDVNSAIGHNLRLFAADDDAMAWLLMRKADQRSQAERTARVEWLVEYLIKLDMRALVLDPAVYTHMLEEADNGDMALFMRTLTYIAKAARVAVIVLHHMHKAAQWASFEDINQGSLRGASAFTDNARSVAVLISLPQKDAAKFGLEANPDTLSKYAVFKHVKHNYSATLGTRLFERRGPLLIHRPDIAILSAGEQKEAKEKQKADLADAHRHQKAVALAEFLFEQPDKTATATQCDKAIGKHGADLGTRRWCVEQGYISLPPTYKNGTALLHTLTPKGIKHLLD